MRRPTNTPRASLGFNMTPMIDVVFQLIIFFLLSSHMAKQEMQLALELPRASTGQETEEESGRRIVINVLPDPRAGGRIVVTGREVSRDELPELIRYEARKSGPALEVRIRTDRAVPYRVVEPVMVACAKAGVWNVTFAVIEH